MTSNLFEAAAELHEHGITVIPVRGDGTKAPALKAWQQHTTSLADINDWFGGNRPAYTALGLVTGTRSGNLEMAEIEGRAAFEIPGLKELAHASGLGQLWDTLNAGWIEVSPSGGIHWFYRVEGEEVPGNVKIATRPSTPEELAENPKEKVKTLAETRGTGGQVVAAPTPGTAHTKPDCGCIGPCGPWARLRGGPTTVPTITAEQRRAFHQLLSTLDIPRDNGNTGTARSTAPGLFASPDNGPGFEGTTPGDDYESKTSWKDILEPAGWHIVFTRGATTYWCRPGKKEGISATTGHADDRDRLYVFSSSTEFETFTPITKLHAYTVLHHGGNHSAAASALRKGGFGETQHVQHPAMQQVVIDTPTSTITVTGTPEAVGNVIQLPDRNQETEPAAKVVPGITPSLTDDANAMQLIRLYGDRLRFNADQGRWLAWQGYRWEVQPSHGGYARELAKQAARELAENGPEGKDKHLKHKRYSLSERGISSMLNTARTDPTITIGTNDLDSHPWELNTPTGIVDLRTGKLHPSDPAKLHTRSTLVGPDPQADSTVWEAFLDQTMPDESIRSYMQRLAGYSAIGEVLAHILPFAHGEGGNGKGVFLETLKAVLGSYSGKAPSGFLMAAQYQGHATELADLAGRRLVICSEVNKDDKFDEQRVTELTGGDTVKARFMRQDFFEFRPTHHLWLMGNHQPAVEAGGHAFWRRLRLIPFTNTVPEDQIVDDLQGILAREHGAAVLNWIIAGAVEFANGGLREPSAVRAATKQYAEDVDTVGRFLEDECFVGPSYANQSSRVNDVREAYERWCHEAGEKPHQGRAFTSQLARHGVITGRLAPKGGKGVRLYGGILLKPREDQLDPFAGDRGGF